MKFADITVVIPVKERFDLLKIALESINKQTLIPKKVIIIDDASSKKINLIKKYNFNLKIFRNKKNTGVSASRNKGIKLSKTKYICFIDSDDVWKKNKIRLQFQLAEKNKLDFVYCNYKNSKFIKNIEDNKEILKRLINKWSNPNCSTFFFRRLSLLKLGSFDEKLKGSEDHDIWFRLSQSNLRIGCINKNLVITEKFNYLQISRNYFLRKESLDLFFRKHKNSIPEEKLKELKNHIYTKAFIPVLNASLKKLEIITIIKCLRYLIFSKLFYKRYLYLLFRNFFN
tara:strand:- start:785 stop:1639 length:855 start_codon:yes stop_codon:yes gene_type:complete